MSEEDNGEVGYEGDERDSLKRIDEDRYNQYLSGESQNKKGGECIERELEYGD